MGSTQARLKVVPRGGVELDGSWRHALWPSRKIDAFVVSFPKSGRTWLRVLMAVAEARSRGEDAEPIVHEWLESEAPPLAGRAILFTHALSANARESAEGMSHFLGYIGDRRRLFLVRDPRDTVVSYFFQVAKRQGGFVHDRGDLGRFIRDPGHGIDRLLTFLCACERSLRDDSGPVMLASYEELHRDPSSILRSVLEFFGAQTTEEALEQAVTFGRFDNMRRLELEGRYPEPNRRLRAPDLEDTESFKTRRGVVGGFREYFSDRDLAYVEERIAARMPSTFGYREAGMPPPVSVREGVGGACR